MNIEDLIESINLSETKDFISIDSKEPIPKMPYQVREIARIITNGIKEPHVQAYAIHNWVTENVSYNKTTNENFDDRDSIITSFEEFNEKSAVVYALKNKAGTCYSMTRLYVALAKSIGLDARIARVLVDCDGITMGIPGHVCAMVDFVKDHFFFDPAYKNGDAKHKSVEYLTRAETNAKLIEDILNAYQAALKFFDEKEDYKKQVVCCDKALYLFPENKQFKSKKEEILNTVGFKNMDLGHPQNATVCFKEILKIDPDNVMAKKNLELAQAMVGDKK